MNILHITDFHFSEKGKDPSLIIKAIINCIKSKNETVDFVFFTGDLVNAGGDSAPFDNAQKVLFDPIEKQLMVDRDNIIICPGNHDIDRAKISRAIKSYIDDEIKSSNDNLNAFYKNKSSVDFINTINPSKGFYSFIKKFYSQNDDYISDLYTIHLRNLNNKKIGITCVNTAWLSAVYPEDKGNLLIPTDLLQEVKTQINSCEQKIILIHHPLYFLKDFNFNDIENIVHSQFDLMFSGHVHKISSLSRHNGSNGIFEHVSKASLSSRENLGCSLIKVDDVEENKITVHEITYIEDANECHISPEIIYTIPCGTKKAEILSFRKKLHNKIEIEKENANNLLLLRNNETDSDFLMLYNHPVLKTESESNLESKNCPIISFDELIASENNYLILGKDKCGKTTLLKRLQIEHLINFSRNNRIPFYIDAKELEHRVDDKFSIEQIIKGYYDSNSKKVSEMLASPNFILLVDNFSPNSGLAAYLDGFIEKYPTIKYLICSEYNLSRTVEKISLGGSSYEKIFFHELRRQEVASYTEKRLSNTVKKDDVQQKIIQLCKQLELPLNYWTISLLLLIHNKSSDSYSKNLFSILDICTNEIFDKKQILLSKIKVSYDQLKRICSELAQRLFEDHALTTYSATDSEIKGYLNEIIDNNERIVISSEKVFEFLRDCGVLKQKHEDGRYVFRLNGFFEYFLAYEMTKDSKFRKHIMDNESMFIAFKNQIEIYSGFRRDDFDFLNDVFDRVNKKLDPIFSNYDKDKDKELLIKVKAKAELEEFCKNISVQRTLSSMEKAKIEDDASELHINSEVHLIEQIDVNNINSELIERYLSILARTFRSTDEISGNQDKISEIFDYIIDGYCNLGFVVVEEFKKAVEIGFESDDNSDVQNLPELELLNFISNFTPLICQVWLFDGIGHYTLENKIKQEIDKIINSKDKNSEYRLFMLCFLLLDIDLEGNKTYIGTAMDHIRIPVLKYAIVIKLNYYLAFKGGKKEFQQQLSNHIQHARLNLDSSSSIGDIHRQIQRKKKESMINVIAKKL